MRGLIFSILPFGLRDAGSDAKPLGLEPRTRRVITTDYSDWATNCPEYKVTAVQVSPSNGPSKWQEEYEALSRETRRIATAEVEAAE
jgi:predicted molibdopterin-dependent oxidoreductase YjgC